jgi:hypothetical protein
MNNPAMTAKPGGIIQRAHNIVASSMKVRAERNIRGLREGTLPANIRPTVVFLQVIHTNEEPPWSDPAGRVSVSTAQC